MGRVTRWGENCSLTSSEKKKRLVRINKMKKVMLQAPIEEILMSRCKTGASMNDIHNKLKYWGLLWGVFLTDVVTRLGKAVLKMSSEIQT